MLNISIPDKCIPEKLWITHVLIHEFLGLEYRISSNTARNFILESNERTLEISDSFFAKAANQWLTLGSLPSTPLEIWNTSDQPFTSKLVRQELPIIFGTQGIHQESDVHININLDIFGSAFYSLSRYEEAVIHSKDKHNRFPAEFSLAFKEKFLDRPIVNEYLEILWFYIHLLWPNLKRKPRSFTKRISTDVDSPYCCSVKSTKRLLRVAARNLIKERSIKKLSKTLINFLLYRLGNHSFDPYFSRLEWIMDVNEQAGNSVDFYFISSVSNNEIDGCYQLNEKLIKRLLISINQRGHIIGIHPGYATYNNATRLAEEISQLQTVLNNLKITQKELGGRQHYLRWDHETPVLLDSYGLSHDSTLGFASHAGFRCGCCYEFSLYDLINRQPLSIKERPLIVMERTIISQQYMGLNHSQEALDTMISLKETCRKYNGDFTLLWHNSNFSSAKDTEFYLELIQ